MGLFWQRASLIFYQIYWTQIAVPINFSVFFFRTLLPTRIKSRSIKSLNHQIVKSKDEARIKMLEEGRDNLLWFNQNVPDECLIDLANKRYCNANSN
jgi:hypothetical protein